MRQVTLEIKQPSGHVTKDVERYIDPESRIGKFLYPSGIEGAFGQIEKVELTYSDGHVRTWRVEDI